MLIEAKPELQACKLNCNPTKPLALFAIVEHKDVLWNIQNSIFNMIKVNEGKMHNNVIIKVVQVTLYSQ